MGRGRERTLYGPRGWTVQRGVMRIVDRWVDARASMPPDFLRFAGLGAVQAGYLWDALPEENLDDRQNDAPSCGSLLRACVGHPGEVELLGYVIGPGRDDERVSIEGLVCYRPAPRQGAATRAQWDAVRRAVGLECEPPDEFRAVRPRWRPASSAWWVWWD